MEADFVGMVFFPRSPRFVTPGQAALLLRELPGIVRRVGLFVDPDEAWVAEVTRQVRLDMIQLHGQESPERVRAIQKAFALPVMKAIALRTATDLERAEAYLPLVDWLLFDASPPAGADRPGGHGQVFDWSLVSFPKVWPIPWMLAGGLTPANVAEAIHRTGARAVDVSSGVEERPGVKSPARIRAFLAAARGTS